MKDLVDVVMCVTHEGFALDQLARAIRSECAKRGMEVPRSFEAPESWGLCFASYAASNGVPAEHRDFRAASSLASRLFDPALAEEVLEGLNWGCKNLEWMREVP